MLIQHSYYHSSIWKFCYSSYPTPKLKNVVILAVTFSPLISKFYQLVTWNSFGLVIQFKFFLEIGRNYASITITIISNITDYCVTHKMLYILNVLCLWAMVSIRRFLQLSPPPPPPNRFSPGLLFSPGFMWQVCKILKLGVRK